MPGFSYVFIDFFILFQYNGSKLSKGASL